MGGMWQAGGSEWSEKSGSLLVWLWWGLPGESWIVDVVWWSGSWYLPHSTNSCKKLTLIYSPPTRQLSLEGPIARKRLCFPHQPLSFWSSLILCGYLLRFTLKFHCFLFLSPPSPFRRVQVCAHSTVEMLACLQRHWHKNGSGNSGFTLYCVLLLT